MVNEGMLKFYKNCKGSSVTRSGAFAVGRYECCFLEEPSVALT